MQEPTNNNPEGGDVAPIGGNQITPHPGGVRPQCSTEQTTSQVDDLAEWMESFISTPAPKPAPRYAPIPETQVFDALVLFTKLGTCKSCGFAWSVPYYLGIRKPVKNGCVYLAYSPEMSATVAGLPRLEITNHETSDFCSGCFGGSPQADDPQHGKFHPSRITTLDDLRLFAAKTTLDFPVSANAAPSRHHLSSDGRTYT